MWERKGRQVKDSELGNPAKEVKKRGAKDPEARATEPEDVAEVWCSLLRLVEVVLVKIEMGS